MLGTIILPMSYFCTMRFFFTRMQLLGILLFCSIKLTAQEYVVTTKGSKLEFAAHMPNTAGGRAVFGGFSGSVIFDPANSKADAFDISIKGNSLTTTNSQISTKLKSGSFFGVEKSPVIRFKSVSVSKNIPNGIVYQMQGLLTIKGITNPVSIQFTASPIGKGYMFQGSFTINPSAFGIGNKGEIDDLLTFFLVIKAEGK